VNPAGLVAAEKHHEISRDAYIGPPGDARPSEAVRRDTGFLQLGPFERKLKGVPDITDRFSAATGEDMALDVLHLVLPLLVSKFFENLAHLETDRGAPTVFLLEDVNRQPE
jgi:hypothetical protein